MGETVDHLLFACDFSQAVMLGILRAVKLPLPRTSWRQWMVRVTRGKTSLGEFVYFLWQQRNCRVFHIQNATPAEVSSKVLNFMKLSNL
ncbi:hypothetical protein Dimus_008735 [Dionaea muscipula]